MTEKGSIAAEGDAGVVAWAAAAAGGVVEPVPAPARPRRGAPGWWNGIARAAELGSSLTLLVVFAVLAVRTAGWPLVNDAALMHYVVRLAQHGLVPYRTIHDINTPGAYLSAWVLSWVPGSPDLLWRVWDLLLGLLATGAMVAIASLLPARGPAGPGAPKALGGGSRVSQASVASGVFGGVLLALFHARDGIGQAGQRDYELAVLLLGAAAALLWGVAGWRARVSPWLAAGLALGLALTIKPVALLFALALPAWAAWALRAQAGRRVLGPLLLVGLAGLVAPGGAVLYLVRVHGLAAFLHTEGPEIAFHVAGMHPSLADWFAIGAPLSLLKFAWVALLLALLRRHALGPARGLAVLGVLAGIVCFAAQNRAYSYHRYPYVAFLLLWAGVECFAALRAERWLARLVGLAGVVFGVALCAPSYLRTAEHAVWPVSASAWLAGQLAALGAAGLPLDGRVQCIDSTSGCVETLERLHLVQSTGTLYDEFLFPRGAALAPGAPLPPVVAQAQAELLPALLARPPRVVVVSSWLFPSGPGAYSKLGRWPALAHLLAQRYTLFAERSFPPFENGPLGFRVYVLRP